MRKKILAGILTLMTCLLVNAIPADNTPITVTQPDGSQLTIVLHGDEFMHFMTTSDGYTVTQNAQGYYCYAQLQNNQLVASEHIAHNPTDRTTDDYAILAQLPKHLTSSAMQQTGAAKLKQRNSQMRRVGSDGHMEYDKFRGLIILINFNDKQFSLDDPKGFYDQMANTHDYTSYTNSSGQKVKCVGSVRDYFYDNSNHIFDPQFDVVGPVTVDFSCTYPQSTSYADDIFNAALTAVDDSIDFSDYDTDGDGVVDMVFFMVAGFSASYVGNSSSYLWPHMFYLFNEPKRDGVDFGLYACSCELYGWEGYYYDVNGIGTFCHEFSHVLGLPDLYDTDYNESGGSSHHPGAWDVMAGGSSNNVGRAPVGYSLYERYALGFAQPQIISQEGSYTLNPISSHNEGYRINTPNSKEYFLLENRQRSKWDAYLPGYGMLVARVDSTNSRVWQANAVNANPAHMYYEILRAGGGTTDDTKADVFPGSSNVTDLNNYTSPSLQTWDKLINEYGIENIADNDGIITFDVFADNSVETTIEDFESMPVTTNKSAKGVQGVYTRWDFTKCAVTAPDKGQCNGKQAVAMTKPSRVATSTTLNQIPILAKYTVYNPTSMEAHFQLTYSVDSGATWTSPGDGYLTIAANETATSSVSLPYNAPIMLRINQTAGSSSASCYLDDITILYRGTWGPETILGDVNDDGMVSVADINAIISIMVGQQVDDTLQSRADVNGDGSVTIADINAVINIMLTND